jgi:hypothetical protein
MTKTITVLLCILVAGWLLLGNIIHQFFVTRNPVSPKISVHYYFNPITKKVFYSRYGNWLALGFDEVVGIRTADFKVLGPYHGATNNSFVFQEKIFPQVEASTMRLLTPDAPFYVADDKAVYTLYWTPTDLVRIEGADPSTFEFLGENRFRFAKDKRTFYSSSAPVAGISLSDLEVLDGFTIRSRRELIFIFGDDARTIKKAQLTSPEVKKFGSVYLSGSMIYWGDHVKNEIVSLEVKDPSSLREEGLIVYFDDRMITPDTSPKVETIKRP